MREIFEYIGPGYYASRIYPTYIDTIQMVGLDKTYSEASDIARAWGYGTVYKYDTCPVFTSDEVEVRNLEKGHKPL